MAQSKLCFDDLPDDMIIEIFSRLPTNKLLSTETVSRSWSRCVDKTLNRVEVLAFVITKRWAVGVYGCHHLQEIDLTKTLIFSSYCTNYFKFKPYRCFSISTSLVDSMLPLLSRCHQVKCLVLQSYFSREWILVYENSYLEFEDIDTLKKLLNALPQLECLYYGEFNIKEFNIRKWLSFCQEVGPRFKHLTNYLNGFNEISDCLVKNSKKLEFSYFISMSAKNICYLKSLRNHHSIDLRIYFKHLVQPVVQEEIDGDTAEIISKAKYLSTYFGCLQSVAKHCPTFPHLNRLEIEFYSGDTVMHQKFKFPALEHLVLNFYQLPITMGFLIHDLDSKPMINHLNDYNLSGLKSLTIDSEDNDYLLTALAGKLKSLKKLVSQSLVNNWPTDSLFLLKQLVDLQISRHCIEEENDLPRVVRLLEVVAEMRWLKRCRVEIIAHSTFHLNPLPDDLKQQLIQAQANLRKSLPFVEIDFSGNNWFEKILENNLKTVKERK